VSVAPYYSAVMGEAWEPIRRTGAPQVQDIHTATQRAELVFPLSATLRVSGRAA
jgi:hypothetical protein